MKKLNVIKELGPTKVLEVFLPASLQRKITCSDELLQKTGKRILSSVFYEVNTILTLYGDR